MRRVTNSQKLIRYLKVLINADDFKDQVDKLRKFYKIPLNGYSLSHRQKRGDFSFSSLFLFPKEFLNNNSKEYNYNNTGHFIEDVIAMFEKFNENRPFNINANPGLLLLIKDRVLYGNNLDERSEQEIFDEIEYFMQENNLIKISKSNDYWFTINLLVQEKKLKHRLEIANSLLPEIKKYPVILKLSSAVTNNDLKEYIKKNRTKIQESINIFKHKNDDWINLRELGDKRKNILKNINKDTKVSIEDVRKKLNTDRKVGDSVIGYEYIYQVKSRERKRRQKVVPT